MQEEIDFRDFSMKLHEHRLCVRVQSTEIEKVD